MIFSKVVTIMIIYYTKVTEQIELSIEDYISHISQNRIERIQKLRFLNDQNISLLSGLLLKYSVSKYINFDINKLRLYFHYNSNKKPFLKNLPSIHFNLSHSGNYIVCAISNQNIGIDIEKHVLIDFNNLVNFFHQKEKSEILSNHLKKEKIFYDIWTKKESFVKFIGTGLTIPLNSFYSDPSSGLIIVNNSQCIPITKVFSIHMDNTYSCSICTQKSNNPIIEYISLDKLLSAFTTNT